MPGVAAAEAEADREDRLDAAALFGPEIVDRGGRVLADLRRLGLRDVRLPIEVVAARLVTADSRRAAKVVDGDGVVAVLGEALGQLFIVVMQAANVGQDHHADTGGMGGAGREGGELGAVGRFERQHARVERASLDGGDRWPRAGIKTH